VKYAVIAVAALVCATVAGILAPWWVFATVVVVGVVALAGSSVK
jgi:hypothetical protein